jgi:hypothetical protein
MGILLAGFHVYIAYAGFLALQTAKNVGLSLRGMYKVLACVFLCVCAV